jgi:hypothetical protein
MGANYGTTVQVERLGWRRGEAWRGGVEAAERKFRELDGEFSDVQVRVPQLPVSFALGCRFPCT